jgi:RNA polymerase sigma factor (sigma-70 family)
MTDAELVAVARRGDRGAFAALVERHHDGLLAACHGDEDAAQEAVLAALLGLDQLRDADAFGAWLAGIGRNLRRRRARREPTLADLLGGRAAPGADELAVAADRAARVRRAVAALPPGQRAAVALSYFAGLSHAEVAAQLRTRPGAVKARLHKARATLRRALHEEAPTMSDLPVRVADVRRTAGPPPRHVVVLEGEGASLPIWIGEPDARALAATLGGVELPRPGSHRLAAALLAATGRRLERVRVARLVDDVFYAEVVLDDGTAIDARPSDALHLALVTGAPVAVAGDVLAAVADPDELTAALLADLEDAADDAAVLADEVSAAL